MLLSGADKVNKQCYMPQWHPDQSYNATNFKLYSSIIQYLPYWASYKPNNLIEHMAQSYKTITVLNASLGILINPTITYKYASLGIIINPTITYK